MLLPPEGGLMVEILCKTISTQSNELLSYYIAIVSYATAIRWWVGGGSLLYKTISTHHVAQRTATSARQRACWCWKASIGVSLVRVAGVVNVKHYSLLLN